MAKGSNRNLRGVGDGTRSGEHGTRGSPPWPERDGGGPLGPTPRPEGLGEVVLAAVALHGAHWAIYHAVMPRRCVLHPPAPHASTAYHHLGLESYQLK